MQKKVTISNILGGHSISEYFSSGSSYLSSIAVDPDMPVGANKKASGCLVPVVYEEFSGANITGYPKWLLTNIKNALLYAYASDGKVVSYSATLASETLVGTPTSGAGNGATYYNNYLYFATPTNVSRYGPLNGSPALVNTVWTGATLGSQTALADTTYPTIGGVSIPNHVMHTHADNSVYFADVVNGAGVLHRIKTSKTTAEGDTNNSSAYNSLDLPAGWFITDVDSWGLDVAILAIQTSSSSLDQGKAALFLWDPTNTLTFYRGPIYLPDPIATSLVNANGRLYIWSGNAVAGVRLSEYIGGDSISEIAFSADGLPPLAGACDVSGSRIAWGQTVSIPETAVTVMSYGSKNNQLPKGIHNIARATSATGACTALKYVEHGASTQKMVIGSGTGSAYALDKYSTSGTYDAIWRSDMITVGSRFTVDRIRIPLGAKLEANMSLVVKIFYDDGLESKTLTTINTTNFSENTRKIIFNQQDILDATITPQNNFYIQLEWAGTVKLPVIFPIDISIDVAEDENND
ncbi:MAG: hypothetical protein OEV44_01035 [Spirochaetota bacterium]|nr:hypothetical protein [Spirochaetota bacterium]